VILIDTSVLSTVLRRRGPGPSERALSDRLEKILKAGERVAVPGVVLQEILSGIRESSAFEKMKNVLLGGYPIVTASVGDHVLAADVVNRCRRKGVAASSIDALIAALALNARARLFTTDEDFKHISRIVDPRLLKE
jgi:predicted nucleic acid-binding protein